MKHELKIWPQFYDPVMLGEKTFEYRNNDRAFQKGDTVRLREWNPETERKHYDDPMGGEYVTEVKGYTGRECGFEIGYVLPVSATHVVFSLIKPCLAAP